ncbi:MAG TPA: competence protein CoiA family protein [Pyrinomonadaceae bacterium]|nr:competence protein CoiA family protein [Pyrinomonadaceae bacterium]
MLYADDQYGNKIEATPNSLGFCPACNNQLIPRCGQININHWAHRGRRDCDDWYEPETEWHADWKRQFGKENCEVVIPPHRADIVGKSGIVIELQHSPISPEEIWEREDFYRNMIWIVDANQIVDNLYFFKNPYLEYKGGQPIWSLPKDKDIEIRLEPFFLEWKRLQKRWASHVGSRKPAFLDLSQKRVTVWTQPQLQPRLRNRAQLRPSVLNVFQNLLFRIVQVYPGNVVGGKFITKQRIIENYKP